MMERILIVDDEAGVRYSFRRLLSELEAELFEAEDFNTALKVLSEQPIDLVLLDVRLGEASGLDLLNAMRERAHTCIVIVMTAYGTAQTAIEATRLGAYDYVLKPFDRDTMLHLVREALRARRAMATAVHLQTAEDQATDDPAVDNIIGSSEAMQEVYKLIGRVAAITAPILIVGESGTGKELVARAVYTHSPRRDKIFLPLNCAAIPEHLLESEFFGHEKGAFTGAVERRLGKFEQCHGGTIFLDEIGDMPLSTQAKLLRVLEDGALTRVGGRERIHVDVRIIAATNQDLAQTVANGKFREDLYYRLNVVTVRLPALRERRTDIRQLVEYFVRRYARAYARPIAGIAPQALALLEESSWPGNVRQLENALRRAVAVAREKIIQPEDILLEPAKTAPAGMAAPTLASEPALFSGIPWRERARRALAEGLAELTHHRGERARPFLAEIEDLLIELAMHETSGNQARAAALLGMSRNTLRKRLQESVRVEP